jgi:hypothetical protein
MRCGTFFVAAALLAAAGLPAAVGQETTTSAAAATPAETAARLDATLAAHQNAAGLKAAATCDDATFLRRAWIDLAGRTPPFLAARDFLADSSASKRARLVDSLLTSEEFAEHWGGVLTLMLTERRPVRVDTHDGRVLREYLAAALRENRSYRDIARELIAGGGLSETSGPANFLLRYDVQPNQLTGAIGKQFLGISLQCTECHNHPWDKWAQDDFRGIQAFFVRTKRLDDNNAADYLRAVVDIKKGELEIDDPKFKPMEGQEGQEPPKIKVPPRLLGGVEFVATGTRREALADWVTSENNAYFARNMANRVWAKIFSRGLVEPLDSLGAEKPVPHADVLEPLAQGFAASGHDLKWLLRTILLSQAYQRTSAAAAADGTADPQAASQVAVLARFPARSLTVDELYQSVVQATGHTGVDEAAEAEYDEAQQDQVAYADRPVEFLGERSMTVQRSLVLLNSPYVQEAAFYGTRVTLAAQGRRDAKAQLDFAFLAALSRQPTAEETEKLLPLVSEGKGSQGLEDLWWLLLNSAEFSANH